MKPLFTALLFAGLAFGQYPAPDVQFQNIFTTQSPGPAQVNKTTPAVAWQLTYFTNNATGVSVQMEGTDDLNGSPDASNWTALTAAAGSTSPATGTTAGSATYFPVYYPWVRVNPTTFTGSGTYSLTARVYGYKGTSAASVPPSGMVNPMTALGDMIYGETGGDPTRLPGTTATLPQCLTQAGTGSASGIPSWQPCPNQASLSFYFQNSILATATYSSGGSFSGTGACTLGSFNGGGSGATASIAVASNVPGAITVTAPGTQYTSAPTSATLASGTATCSGTPTLTSTLNAPSSDLSPDFPALAPAYTPNNTAMVYTESTGTGTQNIQDFVTAAGNPGVSFFPAGDYQCHLHASRSNGFTGIVVLQCEFIEVSATGTVIGTIGTTDQTQNIGLSEAEYTLDYEDSNTYVLASNTSRVVCRVQSVYTVSVAGTLTLYVGGTADPRMTLPNATVNPGLFVPYTGANQPVSLGLQPLSTGYPQSSFSALAQTYSGFTANLLSALESATATSVATGSVSETNGAHPAIANYSSAFGQNASNSVSAQIVTAGHSGDTDSTGILRGMAGGLYISGNGNVPGWSAVVSASTIANSGGGSGKFANAAVHDCPAGAFPASAPVTTEAACYHSLQAPVAGLALYYMLEEGGLPSKLSGSMEVDGNFKIGSTCTGCLQSCQPGLGDGYNSIAADTYLQSTCFNDTGQTVTFTGIKCFSDNSGASTLQVDDSSGNHLINAGGNPYFTCSPAFASGTQSSTVTLAAGAFLKFTFVADGTSKQTTWVVSETY